MLNMFFALIFAILMMPNQLQAAEVTITKIRMSSSSNSAQIYIVLSEIPTFSKVQNGRRVDILLNANLTNTEPLKFTPDDQVVKFLTQEKKNQTILTFFLRYEPQKVEISHPEEKTLVLDILLGNQFTKTYPELTSKLQGLSIVKQQTTDYANPYIASPYSNNWRSFFAKYEPDIRTSAPISYSSPPFPVIDLIPGVTSSDILPAEIFTLSSEEKWKDMLPLILDLIKSSKDEETIKQLALTYGEILFRADDYQNGYKQLFLLNEDYKEEYVGIISSYLLSLLRAKHEDPFVADYQYRQLEKFMDERFVLSPYLLLSQIETALATEQLDRAATLLAKDDIAFSPRLAVLKDLRQSDYWFATDSFVKAFVGYQLLQEKKLLESHPYSLNGYCNTLYHQKKYKDAAHCFDTLSSNVTEKKYLSMISLKKAMAELQFKTAKEMYVEFSRIEDAYPNSPAGLRAALKKTDIRYLSQPSWRKTSVNYYRQLANSTIDRDVAEEAALKEAVVYAELGNKEKSIDLLLNFLRVFRAGNLVSTAQALLIEILPSHLEKLLSEKQYVKAIVLAKKNREFFQKNWINIELLGLLAKAYHELGIFSEAQKLYLYLLRTADPDEEEDYYLPLLSILYAQGNYDLVEDYATQYKYNYQQGKEIKKINLILLQSLIASGKDQKALELLSSPLPENAKTKEIAATLYFTNNKYDKTIETLSPLWTDGELPSDDAIFILAESLFQENFPMKSQQLFKRIKDNKKFSGQAKYRLALIARQDGHEDMSLKLFREIVEKGSDPLWQKLAQKELDYNELNKQYKLMSIASRDLSLLKLGATHENEFNLRSKHRTAKKSAGSSCQQRKSNCFQYCQ